MAENDYSGSFGEGQTGQGFSGGNSIDYAGYMAGRDAAFRAELSRSGSGAVGGGGGGVAAPPMNLTQKALRLGVMFGLIGLPLGALWQASVLGAAVGVAVGFGAGVVIRFSGEVIAWPFKRLVGTAAFLPAMVLGFVAGSLVGGGPVPGVAVAGVVLVLWLVRQRRTP